MLEHRREQQQRRADEARREHARQACDQGDGQGIGCLKVPSEAAACDFACLHAQRGAAGTLSPDTAPVSALTADREKPPVVG